MGETQDSGGHTEALLLATARDAEPWRGDRSSPVASWGLSATFEFLSPLTEADRQNNSFEVPMVTPGRNSLQVAGSLRGRLILLLIVLPAHITLLAGL